MTDVERLLQKTIKPALMELSKTGVGSYSYTDEEGIHYTFDGRSYLIAVKEERESLV